MLTCTTSGMAATSGCELNAALITAHPQVYAGLAADDLKTHLDAVRTFLGLCFQVRPDAETFERLLANAAMAS
ncbi:Alpha/beta fold family hydrolase [Pseudomonas syringae pv. cilantro]|uniref:Alpha/beta fold family hydrolase n=2 Tax=Pseudomonas syringae group TaxID=136849 RepID=A0A0N0XBQ7_PSESX|nr:Alpha/beta fold family hydrolase [Pseudomonas syringae pv. cilantro]RMN11018.1 Alpha/beta fold family hydrolase [Pseudomonas syringae pv. coriandricola]